jgi:hypothetical protein
MSSKAGYEPKSLATTGLLSVFLKANIFYFVAMSVAHWMSFKIPVLFIYYDTPFYAYQDKVISFCAATYALFCLAATYNRMVVPYFIVSLAMTTVGLAAINSSEDLLKVLPKSASTSAYWIQTCMIGAITLTLSLLYANSNGMEKNKVYAMTQIRCHRVLFFIG